MLLVAYNQACAPLILQMLIASARATRRLTRVIRLWELSRWPYIRLASAKRIPNADNFMQTELKARHSFGAEWQQVVHKCWNIVLFVLYLEGRLSPTYRR